MKLSDFDFELPDELIATRPVYPRRASKLLVADPISLSDVTFSDLVDFLRPGDRLVLNDTKVIPARLTGKRYRDGPQGEGGAKIEVTLLGPTAQGHSWTAMVKPLRKIQLGETIEFSDTLSARYVARDEGIVELEFSLTGDAFDAEIARIGAMPLPPYIAAKRAADAQDHVDYQTIWAKELGAVAAPTASLHFDEVVMDDLKAKGVQFTYVTLHVGAGTFLPVKTDEIADHKMHSEWGEVTQIAADEMNETRANGGRIIPVGTTSLRLIETMAHECNSIAPWIGETDIFIKPGFEFGVADGLITNFHLPKSTLLMLVSALMGTERMKYIYDHAIQGNYRFFSYGDASLLLADIQNS